MTEIYKLHSMLCESNIPNEIRSVYNGWQIFYPSEDNIVCDVIYHQYSYGYSENLLEIMGLVDEEKVGDTVEGYLTAEEIFGRIKNHYLSVNDTE